MNKELQKPVFKLCKELGCCDACSLRYIGAHVSAYEDPKTYILKHLDPQSKSSSHSMSSENLENEGAQTDIKIEETEENSSAATRVPELADGNDGLSPPPAKRIKIEICPSCLGILQESTWLKSFEKIKEQLDRKRYECDTFACALSSPIACMLRERSIILHILGSLPKYDAKKVTALKEAWKWSFGVKLETIVGKTLMPGHVAPLLVTVVMEYPDESSELSILKTLNPSQFERLKCKRERRIVELNRRSVEYLIEDIQLEALHKLDWRPAPTVSQAAHCVSVSWTHTPMYLAGRYIKLSRNLPQTPWMVNGDRMMESSVQEIIFQPIAKLYEMAPEDAESHLKFMSAGREDVDVRCLGEGRPFAIEIADPSRQLSAVELQQACEEISEGGRVVVKQLVYVTKDDLTLLKKGEETKAKTYEALCIKLSHTKEDEHIEGPPTVTERDISNINSYRNTDDGSCRVVLQQKTPIRVLHRRPLHTRTRKILELQAELMPDHKQLFVVRLMTEAGTYVKEWVHGELGRTKPSLSTALGASVDILSLDVASVELPWPPSTDTDVKSSSGDVKLPKSDVKPSSDVKQSSGDLNAPKVT